ncbi:LCP family protein [Conexibacter sp. SYSU D00693]|uniref:LCP family protein n=1 Tax=Conexibacter sp. SYSU D00693 TaxID=2812560 RepID=UPI001F1205D4|nr:LCP family protein [Conexibacter sp. SYSU D00693]
MAGHPDPPQTPDAPPPQYTKYRARPRLFGRRSRDGRSPLDELRQGQPQPDGRRVHGRRRDRRLSVGRVVAWLAAAAVAWVVLAAIAFLVSATIHQEGGADAALGGAGFPLTSPNTVLVIGSDQRSRSTAEPGASTSGPSRSDTLLLLRTGGGASARLSIPRDTVVDIPGHGRGKINAAYALGGTELTVRTVEGFLGTEVHHVVEVDFENFPKLIDAMGGIDYTGGCVVSRINGGFKNGGYTLRLKKGKNHLDGRAALALARTRKNECNPRESDLSRARRQQKLFSAMRSRIFSPGAFIRLPFIGWAAPKAVKSDMSGPTLLGLFGGTVMGGSPPTRVLRPTGAETLPDGGAGLDVSQEEVRSEVRRFLDG